MVIGDITNTPLNTGLCTTLWFCREESVKYYNMNLVRAYESMCH